LPSSPLLPFEVLSLPFLTLCLLYCPPRPFLFSSLALPDAYLGFTVILLSLSEHQSERQLRHSRSPLCTYSPSRFFVFHSCSSLSPFLRAFWSHDVTVSTLSLIVGNATFSVQDPFASFLSPQTPAIPDQPAFFPRLASLRAPSLLSVFASKTFGGAHSFPTLSSLSPIPSTFSPPPSPLPMLATFVGPTLAAREGGEDGEVRELEREAGRRVDPEGDDTKTAVGGAAGALR
jgi:hypothetical protein